MVDLLLGKRPASRSKKTNGRSITAKSNCGGNRAAGCLTRFPVGMRCFVQNDVTINQLRITVSLHAATGVKRLEKLVDPVEIIEGYAGEIVMLEVKIGIEKPKIPKPGAFYERAPLSRIGRSHVVVLTKSI